MAGGNVYIGGGRAANGTASNCYSNVRIYEAKLSDEQVSALYDQHKGDGGLVAYLPLDNSLHEVVSDSDVQAGGDYTFVKNKPFGMALSYDPDPELVKEAGGSCVTIPNVMNTRDGTIAFWHYARGPWYDWQPVFDNRVHENCWECWIDKGSTISARMARDDNGGQVGYKLDNLDGPDNWYHVAFSWSRSRGLTRLYVNGVMRAESRGLQESAWRDPHPDLNIGSYHANNDAANGIWDEVRVYDRLLTAGEIAELAIVPPPEPPRGTIILMQ